MWLPFVAGGILFLAGIIFTLFRTPPPAGPGNPGAHGGSEP